VSRRSRASVFENPCLDGNVLPSTSSTHTPFRWRLGSEPSVRRPVGVSPWPKLVSLVFLGTSSSLFLSLSLCLSLFLFLDIFFAAPKSVVVAARVSLSSPISSPSCVRVLPITRWNALAWAKSWRLGSRDHRDTPRSDPREDRGNARNAARGARSGEFRPRRCGVRHKISRAFVQMRQNRPEIAQRPARKNSRR